MIQYIHYFFIGMVAIVGIESLLGQFWNPWYFRHGIPIYRKNYSLPKGMQILARMIKAKSIPDGYALNLIFKDIGENEVAFQEETRYFVFGFRYTPIMHGLIRRNSFINGVEVVGFLNWYLISFTITFSILSFLLAPCGIIFLVVTSIILYFCFRIQSQRYDLVGGIFDEVKESEVNR